MVAADPLRLGTLLTTTTSSVDGQLGELYGVPDVSGAEPEHVELDAAERAGILTLPLLLASHSSYHDASITLRGVFVRERVLCHELPSPPPGVPTELPSDPTLTRRQQVEQHTQDPACAPCHTLIDPIGLGFEHYDAIGRYHDETADGRPVDALGELTHTGDSDGTFDGAIELAHRFAASERVRDCYAKQWFVYALGRHPSMEDRCSLARVTEAFVDGGADVRELVVAVATSDAFLYRQVATGEER
jgi:hypothetical protein